ASAGEKKVDEGLLNQELIQDEGDDSCDEKTLTTPIRSNEEGIPPGQQVDVEGSLQSPNYTQANSNEEASSGERT
ncbi:21527_t:CDS:2, partial [Rhizophagus irregularis]